MRIIAGNNRGTTLKAPKGMATRPTLGRVRESLFSILGGTFNNITVVDLFAGAGGLGFEALSRGAKRCYFVEKSFAAIGCLRENAAKLHYDRRGENAQALIIAKDAIAFCKTPLSDATDTADLIFLDPPYNVGLAHRTMQAIQSCEWVAQGATVVCQCGAREAVEAQYGNLRCIRTEVYGDTAVHFYDEEKTNTEQTS
ncbi:16S rRNA (guanine(966)-N(2))-methyltransferase RsmD [Candidatus Sumerlaeota bacterium]|nr:16S rRNA (guanine(966)-N(2))-methyltransferase RsmD [Candidatus Sumerlaeota bacterium]